MSGGHAGEGRASLRPLLLCLRSITGTAGAGAGGCVSGGVDIQGENIVDVAVAAARSAAGVGIIVKGYNFCEGREAVDFRLLLFVCHWLIR